MAIAVSAPLIVADCFLMRSERVSINRQCEACFSGVGDSIGASVCCLGSRFIGVGTTLVAFDNELRCMDNSLLILHLSDLHFGNESRYARMNMESLAIAFRKSLEQARIRHEITDTIQLVIVTGDITETGKPREFSEAARFLMSLADSLDLNRRNFVFVPGNHDVSWAQCRIVEAEQSESEFCDEELRMRMDRVKLRGYHRFLLQFYDVGRLDGLPGCHSLTRDAHLWDFPGFRLSVAAMNTCEVESHRPKDHRGEIGQEQSHALMEAWDADKYESWLKVVALHHNPVAASATNVQEWIRSMKGRESVKSDLIERYTADVVGFIGKEYLRSVVRDNCVQLVLHGHQHQTAQELWPSQGRAVTQVLSTGSWGLNNGKLPAEEPPSCQLIMLRLNGEDSSLSVYPLVYEGRFRLEGEVLGGAYVCDPAVSEG